MNQIAPKQWKPIQNLVATLIYMADTCISMIHLKQIHAQSLHHQLLSHPIILAKLFRFAAVSPFGDVVYAHKLFDQIPQPNTFFYNTLIRGYARGSFGSASYCASLFNRMRQNGVDPDEFTFNFLIKAQARVMGSGKVSGLGCEIHGAVIKFGFCSHLFVKNGLIHLYGVVGDSLAAWRVFDETMDVDVVSWSGLVSAHLRAGELVLARQVFDQMPEKDVVSWSMMVSGYVQAKCPREALELFWDMRDAGVKPDEVTLVSVVSACADAGDVEMGMCLHSYVYENGFGWMVSLCNALIDMYGKCGRIDQAWQVFNNMSRKSLITWNSMIYAYSNNGDAADAYQLYSSMFSSGIAPDGITFLALLTAYAHKGLIDEGYHLFKTMQTDFRIEPSIEHYGCLVDMLGRAGRLEEAYKLITSMSTPSNDIVWGALLTACRSYGDVNMGEKVLKKLIELKPDEGGYYILLRDIYVSMGRTEEANQIRQAIRENGATKNPGRSWVDA